MASREIAGEARETRASSSTCVSPSCPAGSPRERCPARGTASSISSSSIPPSRRHRSRGGGLERRAPRARARAARISAVSRARWRGWCRRRRVARPELVRERPPPARGRARSAAGRLALEAALAVPVGLAVPHEEDGRRPRRDTVGAWISASATGVRRHRLDRAGSGSRSRACSREGALVVRCGRDRGAPARAARRAPSSPTLAAGGPGARRRDRRGARRRRCARQQRRRSRESHASRSSRRGWDAIVAARRDELRRAIRAALPAMRERGGARS